MFFRILILSLCSISLGCGVKGKPLPPENSREIGIGKPQYKGVDQEMKEDEKQDPKKKEKK